MKTLAEAKKEIVEQFGMFDEWMEKYEYLIELGKNLPHYPDERKTEEKLISGCQSRVWLDWSVDGDKIVFEADSDAVITKGIISLLVTLYSGRTAREIAEDDFSFIDVIGLKENLSPTRSNGLLSMLEKIKRAALENL